MKNITFLEELEMRLCILEDEISKFNQKKNHDYMMENLMHNFDEAMDKPSEFKPGFTEFNRRLIDY